MYSVLVSSAPIVNVHDVQSSLEKMPIEAASAASIPKTASAAAKSAAHRTIGFSLLCTDRARNQAKGGSHASVRDLHLHSA